MYRSAHFPAHTALAAATGTYPPAYWTWRFS